MKIPYAKAGSSKENKTGSWRTFQPVVDNKKCTKCAICVHVCPDSCITGPEKEKKEFPVMDFNYCKGCGICAAECPFKAIAMVLKE